jgi:hypothetical protein
MLIRRIKGATRVCGKSQGYKGLPILDIAVKDEVSGMMVNSMTSAWEPTPDELKRLNAGASVHVSIYGNSPPPMIVTVGSSPDEEH